MSEFEKELEKNMKLHKVAHERESFNSDFLVSKFDIERIFEDWQPPKPLVEVPQIVADAIESIPDYYSAYGAIKLIDMKLTELPLENEDWKYVHDWIFVDDNANKFLKAWIDGYTVKKEQLYILKHIDMSKLSTDDSLYLAHGVYKKLQHVTLSKDVDVHNIDQLHFTKSEVDELNIGSYEQIEVDK